FMEPRMCGGSGGDMMAKRERGKKGIGSLIFGLLNPIRDPSLLVAAILTVVKEGGSSDTVPVWILYFVLFWIAVKAFIWLLINFLFSFVFLARKTGWVVRNPRLAWRLLDALGSEEIIIGGLRPDMFSTEDGDLHAGQAWAAQAAMMAQYGAPGQYPGQYAGPYSGQLSGAAQGGRGEYDQYGDYQDDGYQGGYDRQPPLSRRRDEQSEEAHELLSSYIKLVTDWMGYTEEKWRAVSDSQLGWKPLRGRWNGWEEIYKDAFGSDADVQLTQAGDVTARRFDNANSKGSAASAVACFLHDMDRLRRAIVAMEGGEDVAPRMGGMESRPQISRGTQKSPIIRNPMIVDADG
ncbi:MAG: hypothetical protein ACHQ4H_03600, partial [Ktedonobacterales bacterium]